MKKYKITLIAFVMALALLSGVITVSGVSMSEADPDNRWKYEEMVLSKLYTEENLNDPYSHILYYGEYYEYYSPENTATGDEATPDYVLIHLEEDIAADMFAAYLFGDYLLYQTEQNYPFTFGYGIFIPKTGEVYSLEKAYEMEIEGIEKVFTEAKTGRLIGDMDKDRKLTVKDATYIQKCLAGITKFDSDDLIMSFSCSENPPLLYISDFNRDCKRDIRDATAIQKHVAGLPY